MEVSNLDDPRPAIEFSCVRCSAKVMVCRSCWRNQKYCSEVCAGQARVARHRRNQDKYNKTEAGRESHKEQQKAYRLRQKKARLISLQS